MINKIKVNNFKCFQNSEINFRKLTILAGSNSVGKSSVLQALLLSRITIETVSYTHLDVYKRQEELNAGFEPTIENINDSITPQPYNPDDIKVRREGFSVFEINRMMTEQNDIDLNPDFQRNLVWDNSRKSALIESILLGIPIPVFYFAESKTGKYHVCLLYTSRCV